MVFFYEYQVPTAALPTGEVLDLAKEFGPLRTSGRGWPIDEHWIAGAAIGAAAAGSKAVARLPTMAPIYAIEYVQNQAGKIRSMTGGQASMPFVLWQDGAGRTRDAYDAKGLLIAAIRDPDPVVYLDYSEVKAGAQPDVPDEAYEVPLGKAAIRQAGKDLTLIAWAPATVDVKKALPDLAKAGISVEFIDPRSLKPLDVETLAASARKTRRVLVVEHGHYTASFGSHIISEIVQEVPGVKVKKLAFPDVPGPGSAEMMEWLRPDAPKIVDASIQLMRA
jgi:pyruvate/2-oxoglutarate/acetoin dehydrogenase E1 component